MTLPDGPLWIRRYKQSALEIKTEFSRSEIQCLMLGSKLP